jgi:hypothetical protein
MAMIFSDARLALAPLWFTGSEWADGTAEKVLYQQYQAACAREQVVENGKTPQQKAEEARERKERRYRHYLAYKASL